jgi:hypothetical protein
MSDDQDSLKDKQFSRREFLTLLGAGSLSLGVGSFDNPWLISSNILMLSTRNVYKICYQNGKIN